MYCVFCGAPNVAACSVCRQWVCPRHTRRWLSRAVCKGCRRRLATIALTQAALVAGSLMLIAVIGWGLLR
jgi:hypothetical protein